MATIRIPRSDEPLTRDLRVRFDVWILLAVVTLLIAGLMVVYSSSYDIAFRSGLSNNDHAYYFKRQIVALILGLFGIVVIMQFDYHFFRKLSVLSMVVTLGMLMAVLWMGDITFGARRTVFGIQPSEIAKITMILYSAHWLSSRGARLRGFFSGLVPFAVIVGAVCGLIIQQPDLSTTLLVSLISITLFFLAGADFWQFLLAAAIVVGVGAFMITVLDYADDRVQAWQVALEDPLSSDYQIKLSVMSIGSGGMLGRGLGNGALKYELPAAHTDGPFAVWAEEMGFVGSLFILFWYAFLAWRGFLTARRARDMYGFLLAMGITIWISFQALMNIAVITSTMPFTGMPLPFMSYGGTGILITLLGVGILLNVSRDAGVGRTLRPANNAMETIRESADQRRRNGRSRLSRARRRG